MFAPRVAKATINTNDGEPQRSNAPAHRSSRSSANQAPQQARAREFETSSPSNAGRPTPSLTWDFSRVPVFTGGEPGQSRRESWPPAPGSSIPIQAKLLVGQVDDPLEHEADRVAEGVMRPPDRSLSQAAHRLSRSAGPSAPASTRPSTIHETFRSPGQPLDPRARAYFEPRFGHDFSRVRVHVDQRAADAARSIGARAFTVNDHIVFGDRQYAPDGRQGQHLLAHELAHTVQQQGPSATPTIRRDPIPGWNFTPQDFLLKKGQGVGIDIASDSSFLPAKVQENILRTIAFVLGPAILPPATEGVNAVDFFHGHLVIKKDPATAKESKAAGQKADKFQKQLIKERTKALGKVTFEKYPLTDTNVDKYTKAVEKVLPAFGTLLDEASQVPGAAMMYHTFEFNQPRDLKAQGKMLAPEDPRRHYVTPLDTNQPRQYSPPAGGYEAEYTHITKFSFLVDDKGKVHVRPLTTDTGFTSLELSTITGKPFEKTSEFER